MVKKQISTFEKTNSKTDEKLIFENEYLLLSNLYWYIYPKRTISKIEVHIQKCDCGEGSGWKGPQLHYFLEVNYKKSL